MNSLEPNKNLKRKAEHELETIQNSSKRQKTDQLQETVIRARLESKWKTPESHASMPNSVRQEVRDFHKVKIYVSDPIKLKISSDPIQIKESF